MSEPVLRVVLEAGGRLPSYATPGASGMDLRCAQDVQLGPMERKLVPTGLRIQVPVGFEAQVRPRSGLALRHGLSMVNTPGTIDSDYRGEVSVILINLGSENVCLREGERIAQLVVSPVAKVHVEVVADLDASERGDGGFGSTGTQ